MQVMAQKAPRRRIQPELISPSQAAVAAANFSRATVASSSAQPAAPVEGRLSVKEESELTAQRLGPGRRVYVDFTEVGGHINWKKVGVSSSVAGVCALCLL